MHRDIKPENMLIAADGTLRLADFGLAIDTAQGIPQARVGTLDYFAPEVPSTCLLSHHLESELVPVLLAAMQRRGYNQNHANGHLWESTLPIDPSSKLPRDCICRK